jgi:hypothetical protein
MSIINECKYCCVENCKILDLDKDHWKPFKSLCGGEYNHYGTLTKEEFEERYNGMWYDLSEFAQDICDNTYNGPLEELPLYIKQCIDWGKVWETIEVDYSVYDNYVFRIL